MLPEKNLQIKSLKALEEYLFTGKKYYENTFFRNKGIVLFIVIRIYE